MHSTLGVLEALGTAEGFHLDIECIDAGAEHHRRTGANLAPETLARMQAGTFAAILKGPVGLPSVRLPDGTEAGLLGGVLRNGLDAYANVRPVRLLPGVASPLKRAPGEIDYVIVRENTEGLYASRGRGVANHWAASDVLFMTRPGVERVVRYAFELARRRGGAPLDRVHRVTCVDKSNVLRSFAFFRDIFTEIAREYPDIEADYLYADATAQAMVLDPRRFDVLVMENLLGDILSDLGGGTVGGIGSCPSGNIGDRLAYFEPVHGSAPTIAGKDLANPLSQILSAAMLLRHIGEGTAAGRLEGAVWRALESGALAIRDGMPVGGNAAAARAVVASL